MIMNESAIESLILEAESVLAERFSRYDKTADICTARIMNAFKSERVSASHFAGTDGYGYDDLGRDTLDRIYARVMGAEAAFVRTSLTGGTHALTVGLFGLLRPGDVLLSVTGKPYDTLDDVIGISGKRDNSGSLADFGVSYREVSLRADGTLDMPAILSAIKDCKKHLKVVFFQRSKGYMNRKTLSIAEMEAAFAEIRSATDAFIMVDNCYGEFCETREPTHVGADLIVGSLIKNPGGGMAESGGYLAGTGRAIELCGYRMTAPGVGLEVGASLGQNKNMYKGLFYAPHSVKEALKTATLAAYLFEKIGMVCEPRYLDDRYDIIESVQCGSPELLIAFCRGIQYGSPIDAFVTCEPWAMPGYSDPVIMAAGTFTQGSSLELSADGPVRAPYTAYLQGGLTYESGKIGVASALAEVLRTAQAQAQAQL